MLGGLAAYLLNFLAGKNKNSKLAQSWLAAHRQLLEDNFSVIGQCCCTHFLISSVICRCCCSLFTHYFSLDSRCLLVLCN